MSIAFESPPSRPSRAEIEAVALDLVRRRGREVMAVARRYACSPEDAEDAYQRSLEILLTKAPTTCEADLLAWLKTVVKHEAFALRRKRERDVPAEHDALDAYADDSEDADERAERYDRLRVGAEALARLKPQETQALLLKAEGLSYREIAERLSWSYTKVNRCLTEGRRAFYARVQGIESGAECDRMAPLLSRLADGEASAEDMAALRPHLRGCPACRATLRDYREAPRQVAGLAAPVAGGGVLAWLGERIWSAATSVKGLFEAAAAQKAAVVAASTVAVAGGGVMTVDAIDDTPDRPSRRAAAVAAPRAARTTAPATPMAPLSSVRAAGATAAPRGTSRPQPTKAAPTTAPVTSPSMPAPDPPAATTQPLPSAEQAPATRRQPPATPTPTPRTTEPPQDQGGEFGP